MIVNTKTHMAQSFPGISFAAIKCIDDEWIIIGKFCRVTPMKPDVWDVWICDSNFPDAGLGQRKVNNIVRELEKTLLNRTLTICDGEAFVTLHDAEVISQNLKLLGIRRKRRANPKLMEELRKRRLGKDSDRSAA